SIKAIQITARMSSAGYKLEMKNIFLYPVICELARHITKQQRIPDQSAISGIVPLTPIQQQFFQRPGKVFHHFNQAVMLYSQEGFPEKITRDIFAKIQEHHDALRMTYHRDETGNIIQTGHGIDYPLSLEAYDLRNHENAPVILQDRINRVQSGICLEKGPLMKLALFHLEDGDRLLIVVHHLVIDGVSWRILFEDIENLYNRYKRGEKPSFLPLPPKSDSFKLWAERLKAYADHPQFLKEKSYWRQMESLGIPAAPLPQDFETTGQDGNMGRISFSLSNEETRLLLNEANRAFNTEINDILLTALGMGIKKTFGLERVLIALEGHGREDILEDIDISRTVGWFSCVYPVLMEIAHIHEPGRQLKVVKETLRRIPNKGTGYGILKYLTAAENKKGLEFKLKPQVCFNYLGQFGAELARVSSFQIARESTGLSEDPANGREYELEINGMIADKQLTITVSYLEKYFKKETIAGFVDHFQVELKKLIAFCCGKERTEWTPGDFTYKGLTIESIDRLTAIYPNAADLYALTPMQEGMLFHAAFDHTSHSYFEQTSYRLYGELNIEWVEKSLNELLKRHDILRTAFVYEDIERPVQVVLKDSAIDFYFEDISGITENEKYIDEFKIKDRERSFALSSGSLMRVAIFRKADMNYEFIWSGHHILMDGWCLGILIREFFEIYHSYLENRPHRLTPVTPYRSYIQWLEKQDREASVYYWQNYLDSFAEQTGVPKLKTGLHEGKKYKNETVSFTFSAQETAAFYQLAAAHDITVNILAQVMWGILLSKYNGKDDVIFGAVVSGRPSQLPGVETMVGL
ncbi:MAG TPA: condensation domain-containing protein, partial [Candidatus Deferrimicrobium sp.]|nr:condensation domain-containing protein [Candidatus Deferrimicrobium sp.]